MKESERERGAIKFILTVYLLERKYNPVNNVRCALNGNNSISLSFFNVYKMERVMQSFTLRNISVVK